MSNVEHNAESDAPLVEWGVRSDAGGNGTATYGPYPSREAAEEVRDRLIEGGGWLITRRVTEWADVPAPAAAPEPLPCCLGQGECQAPPDIGPCDPLPTRVLSPGVQRD